MASLIVVNKSEIPQGVEGEVFAQTLLGRPLQPDDQIVTIASYVDDNTPVALSNDTVRPYPDLVRWHRRRCGQLPKLEGDDPMPPLLPAA